ncbi:thioesterase family protein [Sediminibacillus albus]|uniref:Acyl-CoA thioester hydrolase n=1 Tax=Sediminibacillus albus TaxID=407036 RepID=A0A1G8WQY5_9BACI|nr:thioesterase family protein [Sediminibacillus albus]SDJ80694.1 acyl-CoA thioester hydrolase [Sediminibacillus albus]
MKHTPFNYQNHVREEWVDYNGHMNDAAYAKLFSLAVDAFIDYIGLDAEARGRYAYTIFTLETHLCYLKEAHQDEQTGIEVQLLDDDAKRLHVFFTMKNSGGEVLATSEQMLMGMDVEQGRPAPFPTAIASEIERLRQAHEHLEAPKQMGRRIGIKR